MRAAFALVAIFVRDCLRMTVWANKTQVAYGIVFVIAINVI